jgi:hypothetical protein
VALGASNLTRGFSTVVGIAQSLFDEPIDIFAALGHGRSYGVDSSVLGRRLPGIRECGLWRALPATPSGGSGLALLTDVGNDLVYGVSADETSDWVEACLNRLLELGYRPIVTGLPLGRLQRLSPRSFAIISRVLFPGSRLSYRVAIEGAAALDARLVELTAARKIPFVRPRDAWYGLDPIHIRKKFWPSAWTHILSSWRADEAVLRPPRSSLRRWWYLNRLRPEHRVFWGRRQRARQPAGRLACGTTIWLY